MIGRANSRNPEATGYSGRRASIPAATVLNSVIASTSRLPWPQTITPILLIAFPLLSLTPSPRDGGRGEARPPLPPMLGSAEFLLLALGLDALIGDPAALYARLPHPVVVIGRGIGGLDRHLNRIQDSAEMRRAAGIAT